MEPVDEILRAVDRLPFLLVHALWLIDVCRCGYDEAAVELGTTPEVVAERVAAARETIRDEIVHKPPD